jgi:non-heme chloroperoxidase
LFASAGAIRDERPTHDADDLSALIEALVLNGATLVGFPAGGGEVARCIGRHGTKRVAKAALISAVPPLMPKTAANPGGLPIEVFDTSTFDCVKAFSETDVTEDLGKFDVPTLL